MPTPHEKFPAWTRFSPALAMIFLLTVAVLFASPKAFEVGAWKLLLVCVAACLGYFIDRLLFPYGRPHTYIHPQLGTAFAWACLRRAIIVAAAMIAASIGV